jgi:hypothetical protein
LFSFEISKSNKNIVGTETYMNNEIWHKNCCSRTGRIALEGMESEKSFATERNERSF